MNSQGNPDAAGGKGKGEEGRKKKAARRPTLVDCELVKKSQP